MDLSLLWDSWTLVAILGAAFLIGWTAEAAQTFIPRALALSILAWLQTLPEFAVEASIAWNQQRDLMIANLTGSLRLLVGLGWPMIFFVYFFFQGVRKRRWISEIHLEKGDYLSVLFLFISILYFILILLKRSLTCVDSVVLSAIYIVYLVVLMKMPNEPEEAITDLPLVSRQIIKLPFGPKIITTVVLFAIGGVILYFTVEPFIHTLQKWAVLMGVSSFVFVQWLAPFLSEFPEKVTAFNWARQEKKAPMALMNMVNSNINQWTMLAAMIPLVFSLSIGDMTPVLLDDMHADEMALTIAQSALGGLLLLDMRFSWWDALGIFVLWVVQFVEASLREEITYVYLAWIAFEVVRYGYLYVSSKQIPEVFVLLNGSSWVKKRRGR